VRLVLDGDKVVAEEKLLEGRNWRIREVKQGPDGAIYILAGEPVSAACAALGDLAPWQDGRTIYRPLPISLRAPIIQQSSIDKHCVREE